MPLEGLNATTFPVFVKTGENLYLDLSWESGTDLTLNLTFNSDSMPADPDVGWNWLEAGHVTSFMAHELLLNWSYTTYGNYSIHLIIGNNIGVEERWFIGYIEPDLNDVMLLDVDYIPSASPVDVEIWMRVLQENETFPFLTWCRIVFGDGSDPELFSMTSETVKTHTYLTEAPNASVSVLCHNHVSNISLRDNILLRTNISNLTMVSVTGICAVNTDCPFVITMESGSHINYVIDAGDYSERVEYRDPSRVASGAPFNFTHVYGSPNNYSLRVYAYNDHFQAEAVVASPVIVQIPVPTLTLVGQDIVSIPDGSTDFVLTGDSTGVPPNQVFCKWNFRNSDTETYYSTEIMQNRPEKLNFVYNKNDVGQPLTIHVDCYNLVSSQNASFTFRVEERLEVLTLVPFVQHGIPDSDMGLQLTLSAGSHVEFLLNYGDGTVEVIEHPQLFAVSEPVNAWHPYNVAGNYTVTVTASNPVNTLTAVLTEDLVIQHRVINLSLSANKSVLWAPGAVGYSLEVGQNQMELTNLHCVLQFDLYVEEYSYLESLTQADAYVTVHTFPRSAIGNATIKVNCSNLVSWQQRETVVEILLDEVILESLETDGRVLWSNITVLTLKIKRFAAKSCFRWELGDGTEILYGVPSCQEYALENSLDFVEMPFGQAIISLSHVYPDIGEYLVSVFAFNHVSNDSLQVVATIDDWPCEKPEVSFPPDYELPLTITRSEPLRFMANVTVNCTKTTKFVVSVEVYTKDGQHLVAQLSDLQGNQITFRPRTFEYGIYEIKYSALLYLNHTVLSVSGMETHHNFELEVTKSPLVVNIVSGTHQWSPWNRTVAVNAMNVTYDPDYPDDEDSLQYTWFCRLINESFPLEGTDISRTPPSHPPGASINSLLGYGGCFGEGPGILDFSRGEFMLDTQKLHVHTVYVLRVEVNKDSRMGHSEQMLSVGAADPPVIELK